MAPRTKRGKVRGHGEGALYFSEARNRWIGVATINDPTAKDGRRRVKVTGGERATTKDKLDETIRKLKEGVPVGSVFDAYGNQFGNQGTQKEKLNDGSEAA